MNKYEIIVRVWNDYFLEIEANTKEEAIEMLYKIEVEKGGMNIDGGEDIENIEEVKDDYEDKENDEEN